MTQRGIVSYVSTTPKGSHESRTASALRAAVARAERKAGR